MIFARRTKLPVVAAVLLSASLVTAATKAEKHPAPKHKAHAASHPPVAHHANTHPGPKRASTHRSSKKKSKRPRGQQAIDNQRAREIQEALVREHYLTGEPSGVWDASTQEALRRYQGEQGWQTKTVPDSRALIRLGLGPDHGRLLNPESAMMTGPAVGRVAATTGTQAPASANPNVPTQSVSPLSTSGAAGSPQ